MLDGTAISQHPFVPGPAPYVANIPLLIGQNRDEATFFYWENPDVFKMAVNFGNSDGVDPGDHPAS